jgi:hypothetical protein
MEDETEETVGLIDLIKILKTHSKKICIKEKQKDYILVGVIG